MPDFGISKAIRKGVRRAKVKRPGDEPAIPTEGQKPQEPPKEAPVEADLVTPEGIQVPVEAPMERAATRPVGRPAEPPTRAPVEPEVVPPPAPVEPEARRLSSLSLGDFDLDEIHQTNFDTITTTDDVKAVIADASERNKGRIDEARRGVITDDQLRGLAADLGVQQDVIRQVMTRESGGTLNAESILAARQVLHASADRLVNLAKKINTGQASDLEKLQFRRQAMFHDDYQTQFMGARAETGRALRAFGIPAGAELEPYRLQKLKNAVEVMNGNDTESLARMVAQIDSVEGVNKFTREYTRAKITGTVQELFINSLLSGPTTHIINATSNALFIGMNATETALAARIGQIMPGADHVQVGEASAMLWGQLSGFRDAMRYAAKAFREGETLDQTVKYEGNTRRAISGQNLAPNSPASVGRAVDFIGAFIRLPTERVMGPTDEFFKTLAYRGELSRQAFLATMQEARLGQMTPEQAAARVKDFMENPPANAVRKGEQAADYLTFQQPLGELAEQWRGALAKSPFAFIIAPFIRTPVNIFKAGLLERSPLGVFSAEIRAQIAKGGPERDLALARLSLGTLTVTSVAVAAASGYITGGGPQNAAARKTMEATGWQPYSFAIPDPQTGQITYHSYARAEPLSYVIGATADAVEIQAFLDYDDELRSESEQMNSAIAAITGAVVNNTMSKTFLQGVADFTEATSDPQRYMKQFLTKTGAAMIPYSSFRRQMGKIQDPLMREGWTAVDAIRNQSGIPGWSEDAPPRRDIFGNAQEWRSGSVLGVMSPWPDSEETSDAVLLELRRLLESTQTVPLNMPGRRIEGMKLTADEYDELVKISRTEPILMDSLTFRDAITNTMESEAYAIATADARVDMLRDIQRRFDTIARLELEARNADVAARLEAHRARQNERMGRFANP